MVDAPVGFVFQNPDHQVVMPSVAADVAFGLGRYSPLRSVVMEVPFLLAARFACKLADNHDS